MLFNSIPFLLFLMIAFFLYWQFASKKNSYQNLFLFLISLLFYALWDFRFLILLLISIGIGYFVGQKISKSNCQKIKKAWFLLSVLLHLVLLIFFKYYNFFATSFSAILIKFGLKTELQTLQILLPIGISFYTFHGLSYLIDIYKNKIKPEKNWVTYGLFVAYFPLLVSGPIERATHLLPQLQKKRSFDYQNASNGIKLMVWGFFKKMVVANNCAFFVNQVFENTQNFSPITLVLVAFLFSFQIYGDFSGYTDIAIGVSKLFGIELLQNFNYPYFSKTPADFWRRWHISLSSWFRDYLYIPLGGSNTNIWKTIRNVLIIFVVSGFWHGANLTFILWGFVHALLVLPLVLSKKIKNSSCFFINKWAILSQTIITFVIISLTWIFFRAKSITAAFDYFKNMIAFSKPNTDFFFLNPKTSLMSMITFFSIMILLFIDYQFYKKNQPQVLLSGKSTLIILLLIFLIGSFKEQLPFIYFQF